MTRYWPLGAGREIESPFGPRSGGFHSGCDFGKSGGSGNLPVYACQSGTVIYAGAAFGYGGPDPCGWLVIDSSDDEGGGVCEYGHIVREVAHGDHVTAGQRIAHINPNSNTNGGVPPHVHLSVMPGAYNPSTKMDPIPWLGSALEPEGVPVVSDSTIFSDISEFQVPVNDSYPSRVLSFRSNDGTHRDVNFAQNYQWSVNAVASGKLEFFIVYCYWRANWDQTAQILMDMVNGQGGPHPKMAVMIDLESGGNPGGDQSGGANGMFNKLAGWLGNPLRVIAYANKSDFYGMWSNRPAGLRVIGAGYGQNPNLPGQIAHQYTDGGGYGGGLPEGYPPFGNCDMNSADGLNSQQFAAACGVGGPVPNAINDCAAANPWVGARVTVGENTCPDGVGKWVEFASAHVYWSPSTGAHAVPHGGLFESFATHGYETGVLGYPVQDFAKLPEGGVQAFQGGILYRKDGSSAGYVVHGAIASVYGKSGYEKSALGWPVSDEHDHNTGKIQDFEHGSLAWDPSGVVTLPK